MQIPKYHSTRNFLYCIFISEFCKIILNIICVLNEKASLMIFLLLRFEQHHGRDIRQEAEAWDLGQVKDGLEQVHRAGGHQGRVANTQQRKGWVRIESKYFLIVLRIKTSEDKFLY